MNQASRVGDENYSAAACLFAGARIPGVKCDSEAGATATVKSGRDATGDFALVEAINAEGKMRVEELAEVLAKISSGFEFIVFNLEKDRKLIVKSLTYNSTQSC